MRADGIEALFDLAAPGASEAPGAAERGGGGGEGGASASGTPGEAEGPGYDPGAAAHAHMSATEARKVLAEAARAGRLSTALNPVGIGVGIDPAADRDTLLVGEAAHIVFMVDPVLRAVAVAGGGRQRGRRTFSFGLGTESANPAGVAAFLAAVDPACLVNKADVDKRRAEGLGLAILFYAGEAHSRAAGVLSVLGSHPVCDAGMYRAWTRPSAALAGNVWKHRGEAIASIGGPGAGVVAAAPSGTYVALWINAGQLFAQVGVEIGDYSFDERRFAPRPDGDPFAAKAHRLRDAAQLVDAAWAAGWRVVGLGGDDTADKIVRLAEATTVVGAKAGHLGTLVVAEGPIWSESREVPVAEGMSEIAAAAGLVGVEAEAADLAAMAAAGPAGVAGLRDYQARYVGAFCATGLGMVNACRVGLGKTICALAGFAARAEGASEYRALVVAPADKRADWCDEAARWFPAALSLAAYSRAGLERALSAMDDAGATPVVLVVSYDLVRAAVDELADRGFDDVCVDEADVLWNANSARSKALWRLRGASLRASVLTGTPYSRELGQLGQLVAYARGDAALAQALDLSGLAGRLASPEGQRELLERLGPVVFREDRGAVADELPEVSAEVVHIEAHPAEIALAHAARDELKRLYESLAERVEAAAALDPDDPKLAAARADLIAARGRMLGGITLARLATSEPAALARSDAAGAVLLRDAGYVDAAVRAGSTKRRILAESLSEVVADGGAALVFSDFAQVAESYAAAFAAAGMRVGTLTGAVAVRRREAICAAYNDGELDVVVLGAVGKRGLNLQTRTNVLVHADLPWTPDVIEQRCGRADRLGAGAAELSEWVPIVADTIEERVAAVVMARGGLAVALDAARGRIEHSDTAVMMRALAAEVDDAEASGYTGILAVAKAVLGV